jgi:hypothetical protein
VVTVRERIMRMTHAREGYAFAGQDGMPENPEVLGRVVDGSEFFAIQLKGSLVMRQGHGLHPGDRFGLW